MTRQSASYYRLLGDLSDVPDEYIRDVSHMKRFLERWTMDPKYQEAFASDPEAALTALGIDLTPAEVIPLIDREAALEATRLVRAGRAAEVPPVDLHPPVLPLAGRPQLVGEVHREGRPGSLLRWHVE